ncbi:hypothetical protein DPQ25_04695 [Hydrogeniiclostridium mannosilyticum]|uniref:Uncharacterized protein n=1 Tax=Hydrogeniiclostridium mannosilyticum TaxID=2764322 RepID=A0A328UJC9_9FIRM|nr:hypothetical protein DPQ25_04695 [Hydrogeniiclostridium mannosilyticum]
MAFESLGAAPGRCCKERRAAGFVRNFIPDYPKKAFIAARVYSAQMGPEPRQAYKRTIFKYCCRRQYILSFLSR